MPEPSPTRFTGKSEAELDELFQQDLQRHRGWQQAMHGLQRGIETGLPIAGGIAGGLLTRHPAGAAVGTALMGQLANITRPHLTGEPSRPLAQQAPALASQAALDLGLGAAGNLLGKGLYASEQFLLAPFKKKVIPEAVAAAKAIAPYGGKLTPAQQSSSWLVDLGENIAEGSLLGGGVVRSARETVPPALTRLANNEIARLGALPKGPAEVSQLIIGSLSGQKTANRTVVRQMYRNVGTAAFGTPVDTSKAVQFIKRGLAAKRADVEYALGVVPEWRQMLTRQLPAGKIINPTTGQPFQPAQTIAEGQWELVQAAKSDLLALGRRTLADPQADKGAKTAAFIGHLLKDAMEESAQKLPPAARRIWEQAEQFVATEGQRLNNEIVRAGTRYLAKTGHVHQLLLKPDNATIILPWKAALPPQEWAQVEGEAAKSLILSAVNPVTHTLEGSRLMRKAASLGLETWEAMFSPAHRQMLADLAQTAQAATAAGSQTGTAKVVVALAQGGALFRFWSDPVSAAILAGPWLLGKSMMTKTGTRFLTTGFQPGRASEVAAQVLGQAATGYPREALRPVIRRLEETEP